MSNYADVIDAIPVTEDGEWCAIVHQDAEGYLEDVSPDFCVYLASAVGIRTVTVCREHATWPGHALIAFSTAIDTVQRELEHAIDIAMLREEMNSLIRHP